MTKQGFDSEFLEKLKAKNDIVDTISKYITLQKKGNNFWACCPFHGEKTPSFSVRQDKQFYHCFGCGESGDVISFIQKYENIDFMKAVKILCDATGMKMPEIEQNDDQRKKKEKRDRYYQLMDETCKFYQNTLKTTKNKQSLDYIKKRNLDVNVIENFKIGLSPDFYSLIKHLKTKGFTEEEMIEFGVAAKGENGRVYDFYGERLIFPIQNSYGDVVAFSARLLDETSKFAKYKNTPQTIIFTKGQYLYGINNIRELKKQRELDFIILMEGQMDVISSYRAGFKNTVGSMGTALTTQHVEELFRLCENIVLCMDCDKAGIEATKKAISLLYKKGFNIKVTSLEGAKDPDEFINKFGATAFRKALSKSVQGIDFVINNIALKYNLKTNIGRSKCTHELLNFISILSTESEREIYLEHIREITRVPVDIMRSDLTKIMSGIDVQTTKTEETSNEHEIDDKIKAAVIYTLSYHLHSGEPFVKSHLREVLSGDLLKLYAMIEEHNAKGEQLIVSTLFNYFDVPPESQLNKIINFSISGNDSDIKRYNYDCIKTIDKHFYQTQINQLTNALSNCQSDTEKTEILTKLQEITKILKTI